MNLSPWLMQEPKPDSKARLFCLPYSGCGASMYRAWPSRIGEIEICAIQLPGRENRYREAIHESYEHLATVLLDEISPYLDKPFAFFGHCASALIAYEASLQLQHNKGPVPSSLFVSSQVAPHEGPHGRYLELSDEQLFIEVENLVTKMGGSPIPDLIELSIGILKKDIELNKRYRNKTIETLHHPVVAIGWTSDQEVRPQLMGGWQEYGDVESILLPGEHYTFLSAPDDLLAIFEQHLPARQQQSL